MLRLFESLLELLARSVPQEWIERDERAVLMLFMTRLAVWMFVITRLVSPSWPWWVF